MLDIREYAKVIDDLLPQNSKEMELIANVYNTLNEALPTTSAQAFARLSLLDSYKPQISALIFGLSLQLSQLQRSHEVAYNRAYTKWVNVGTKPSHTAIEAQIYKDDGEMFSQKYVLDDYKILIEFVKALNWDIDKARESVALAWKDANIY